jgi:hypothetical protein
VPALTRALPLALVLAGPSVAGACPLEVLGASAAYERRTGSAGALRERVLVDVELRSTATVALGRLELGVFLGATLADLEETRAAALPSARPRRLASGGIAFRAAVASPLPAGARRVVRVERELGPDAVHEPGLVAARVAGCAPAPERAPEVPQGAVTAGRDGWTTLLAGAMVAAGAYLARRSRRRRMERGG